MRRFVALYLALDAARGTHARLAALERYFAEAPAADAAWAAWFLTGRRMKRVVRSADLRETAIAAAGLPPWLFEASYDAVGDLAETIALVMPAPAVVDDRPLATWVDEEIAPLAGLPPEAARARLAQAYARLDRDGRFVFGKLLTGAFRVGVARGLVHRAIATSAGIAPADVAQRLIGDWTPSPAFWSEVRGEAPDGAAQHHRPYPFFLAHALEDAPATLGDPGDWQLEWKWDGIRAQLLARAGAATLWSRGEDLVADAFPEIVEAARALPPGTAIDGEILALDAQGAPQPFAMLQRRLNRKSVGAKLVREVPVGLVAYDLLELDGIDLRERPLRERRAALEALLPKPPTLVLSPTLAFRGWDEAAALRDRARTMRAEGLMIKRLDAPYGVGRARGPWWKWKVAPHTIDAVMIYAQAGHGRRASLYTDYTFALWDGDALVPFAKAYSGLTDAEIRDVDAWIRAHTLERFGPVRRVEPALVFELAFEGVQRSSRHRSGVAVRFPRIVRRRTDKPASEADTLDALKAMAGAASEGRQDTDERS